LRELLGVGKVCYLRLPCLEKIFVQCRVKDARLLICIVAYVVALLVLVTDKWMCYAKVSVRSFGFAYQLAGCEFWRQC